MNRKLENMMKKIFTIIWVLFAINLSYSQRVTNIEPKQAGDNIEISYYLDKEAKIEIFISENGGRFTKITKVTGDVGDPVSAGRKKIVWNVLEEYDNFIGNNIVFKVTATPSLKAKQQAKEAKRLANQNLNGHYIALGSSLLSSGYYGIFGVSYEYRYKILGVNASAGYSVGAVFAPVDLYGFVADAGFKLYLSNKKKVVRNLYFNILPFCYFGKGGNNENAYESGGGSIYLVPKSKVSSLLGAGLFLGYSPVWHINERVALGLNFDIGIKLSYAAKYIFPMNWDIGFVIKFNRKKHY